MISVVVNVEVNEGKEEAFESVMRSLVEKTRANESGCMLYALHRGEKPRSYVVIECYESREAFQAHSDSPHFKEHSPKMVGCFAGAPKVDILEEVE